MDPLNKKERTEAFIKMLALFLISVIIVAIPIYYTFKLPVIERSANSSDFESLKKQLKDAKLCDKTFLTETDTALSIYNEFAQQKDNMERDKMQLRYVDVLNKMEDFSKTIKNDTIKPKLYKNVVYSLNKLFSNKSDQFLLEDKLSQASSGAAEAAKEDTKSLLVKQREILKKSLALHGGNKRDAARELGMSERLLNSLLKEYRLN